MNKSKSSSAKEFNSFTRSNYELFCLAETPEGMLRLLPNIIRAVERDPLSKNAFKQVIENIVKEDEIIQRHKQDFVDWMKAKLIELKNLQYSKCPEVKDAIHSLDMILSGNYFEINSGGYLCTLLGHFEKACSYMAAYGCSGVEWLVISNKHNVLQFLKPNLSHPVDDKVIYPNSKDGKKIIKLLGHGFVKASVHFKLANFYGKEKNPHYEIDWGVVDHIVYPPSKEIWQKANINFDGWKVNLDCSPEYNLRYLLLLCRFEYLNPVPICSLPKPNSVLEADELCNQQLLQYSLSCFRTINWDKAPVSRHKIMSMVDRLLAFFRLQNDSSGELSKRGKRSYKKDAKSFIQEILEKEWGQKKDEIHNYQDLRTAVFRAQRNADKNIQETMSDRLITTEIRIFAKEKNWKPKRGKDRKKRIDH